MRWPRHFGLLLLLAAFRAEAQQPFELDPSFRTDIQKINVRGVVPLEDGKVIVSGQLYFGTSNTMKGGARLYSNGVQDPLFAPVPNMGGKLVRWQDKIYSGNGDIVRRVTLDGYNDPDFIMMNSDPLFSSLQGADYHVYPDGSLVITGLHSLYDTLHNHVGFHGLIWFDNTGHVDTTKNHRRSSASTGTIQQLPDGKFMLSCICTQYDGRPTYRGMRIHADGALDTTFSSGINSGAVHAFVGLPDGRVCVGGNFTIAGQVGWFHLVRLMPDGSLDPTFNNHMDMGLGDLTGFGATVISITPITPNKLLVCGGFQTVEGQPRRGICTIDSTGQLLDDFADAGCDTYTYQGFTYGSPDGVIFDSTGMMYVYGAYHGYSDGTTNDPLQRQITRLYAPDLSTHVAHASQRAADRLSLTPNPAMNWVTVDHSFSGSVDSTVLIISDILGKTLRSVRVGVAIDRTVIDLEGLTPGIYLVRLMDQGSLLKAERLVVE